MGVTIEFLVQELSQVLPVYANVLHQFLFLHDLLDFQGAGAAHRMTLVGVSVGEGTDQVRLRSMRKVFGRTYPLPAFNASATRWLMSMPATGA
jgi:hypothetical protein